jgi:hypothetical protein
VQNADFICAKCRIFAGCRKTARCGRGNGAGFRVGKTTKNGEKNAEISVSIFLLIIEVFFVNALAKNALLCYNMY